MTPETIQLVKTSFAHVIPISDQAATIFYDRLFAANLGLRAMFPADMAEQRRKLMLTLATVVHDIDRLEDILPVVRDLARRHVAYGTRDEHYPLVGEALLGALEDGLGKRFTPAVRAAWTETYTILADTMIAATRE